MKALTKHPIGSIREIWAMAWPLMLGLISASSMIFVDRLFLSWYSPLALNAGANATIACYIFLVVPMGICAISEVLVGRLNGEGSLKKIGSATWQMFWFSLLLTPIFLAIAQWMPALLFYNSSNIVFEKEYFKALMCFAPFLCATFALNGFFIGIGKTKIVAYCTLLANLFNIIGDYVLIFGWGPIPALGVMGAAIATGLAQLVQVGILLAFFLKKSNRSTYGSGDYQFQAPFFKEGIKIGAPAGFGHTIEVLAHFLFFRIVMSVSNDHMTIVALVQSFYLLIGFVIEAQSKGISAIVSNVIGAKEFPLIDNVFRSGIKLHTLFFLGFAGIMLLFPETMINIFSSENISLFNKPGFTEIFYKAMICMCLFFLFDGYSWILIGHLTASGDTKFIFYLSSVINLVAYVLPAFFLLGIEKNGADIAWMIIAIYSALNFAIYLWRYKSGKWLKNYIPQKQDVV